MGQTRAQSNYRLRPYASGDAAATLEIFRRAVAETAAADYSPEQVAAWIGERSLEEWRDAMRARGTGVAEVDSIVAGFSDVTPSGYIDMLFVHPRYARRGIATALLQENLRRAQLRGATELTANVSITARPLFERFGFEVVEQRRPVRHGVELVNFAMRRPV